MEIALIISVLANLLAVVFGAWVKLQGDKDLVDYERSQRIRDQATKVAELFSLISEGKQIDTKVYNRYIFELALYLPADLVRQLSTTLRTVGMGADSATTVMELFVAIRKHLGHSDELLPTDIVYHQASRATPNSGSGKL
jgi:hypothetical protein